jgi:hypothetical protein
MIQNEIKTNKKYLNQSIQDGCDKCTRFWNAVDKILEYFVVITEFKIKICVEHNESTKNRMITITSTNTHKVKELLLSITEEPDYACVNNEFEYLKRCSIAKDLYGFLEIIEEAEHR